MSLSWCIQKNCTIGAAIALAGAVAAATPADADIVSVAEMLRGISSTSEQCTISPQTVWITVKGRGFCMRYYLASGGSEGRMPIVFLQGDRLGVLNLKTGVFAVPANEKDINTDDLMKAAVALSRQTKLTAIYLARVGVEGSSGDHRLRHSVLELQATNAALDAIKQKHKFEGYNLLGQSGGAHLVAGLLGLRQDINCAVIGSGPLTPKRRPRAAEPWLEHFNPASAVAAIARNRSSRIMVVTDPADKKVSANTQTAFVRMLEQAGRPAEQYIVQATDENRHGVVAYARLALNGCLRGGSIEEITREVDRLVAQRVAAAAKAAAERGVDANKDNAAATGQPPNQQSGAPDARPRLP